MQTLVGFTQAERARTIIGFISLGMVGCGRTAIPFLIFIHPSIPIGTNTICRVLNLGGSKDFWTKRGSDGEGIFRVDLQILSSLQSLLVIGSREELLKKKNLS